ncbi:tRNA lysidine(34) synthetase TilS [Marinobacter sp. F4206]|uniref:tRNA lysidine(34) synthetase TilS n=1 Tax=Marinobacter sp. F4206 TaxID=2861777 RepID=UPI001C6045D7|nr:tRNA lysidine(34) synthetase TilS [Marinobacter sp. F4206]MBW4936583.1 tRNA lysidine(34) synthetase TilS [Marinobacter sp. F4206]
MTTGAEPDHGFAWPDALCAPVRSLPEHSRLWVALSGGLDSVLLLHLAAFCHRDRVGIRAVHVNHQLQPNAGDTEAFCRAQCSALGIPLVTRRVSVGNGRAGADTGTGGVEEAAREARYAVFEEVLEPGDLLLLAHHADDQVETVLFRLVRGSGVAGLAGMPHCRPLGAGQLARPLLELERAELERWARRAELEWVEDPSNTDQGYDRNYLRHAIIPGLRARWPGLAQRVRHSARACADSEFLNERLAERQWADCSEGTRAVSVRALQGLSVVEQKNLMRWWSRECGFRPPVVSDWHQVMHDLLQAREDREPELRGEGFRLRRFQGWIYLVPEHSTVPQSSVTLTPGESLRWADWTLLLEPVANPECPPGPIRVSTRQGGERVRPRPDGPSKSLKNWFQEQAVPPWERACLPLVFAGSGDTGELIAIGDFWCSEQYSGGAPAAGWRLVVKREFD